MSKKISVQAVVTIDLTVDAEEWAKLVGTKSPTEAKMFLAAQLDRSVIADALIDRLDDVRSAHGIVKVLNGLRHGLTGRRSA